MRANTYHLPAGRNVCLVDPPLNDLPAIIAENKRRLAEAAFTVAGVPHREVAAKAREEALARAVQYTRSLGVEPKAQPCTKIIIAAGHQPGMNHPGVWIKNHLIDRLARQLGGTSVNIVLDTDTHATLDFQVPNVLGSKASVEHFRCIPALAGVAVEEQQLSDPGALAELQAKALPLLPFDSSCMAAAYLEDLRAAAEEDGPLSRVLTRARRKAEERWGIENLELPYSFVCDLDSFRLLLLEIFRRAEEFVQIYNAKLAEYRAAYKVHGKANPLPDLAVGGERIELPLWIWRAGGERRPLVLRRTGSGIEILLGRETVQALSKQQLVDAAGGIEALRELAAAGIRIRSKALVTTIYMRLFLFDIFVHGIGGGNYDIITDEIIRDFFGIDPPAYAVATANVAMPFQQRQVSRKELIKLREQASHLYHGPHNFAGKLLPDDHSVAQLLTERREVIRIQEQTTDKDDKARLFRKTKGLDARLRDKVVPFIADRKSEIRELEETLQYNSIVTGREYPFCIYPEEVLRKVYSFGEASRAVHQTRSARGCPTDCGRK